MILVYYYVMIFMIMKIKNKKINKEINVSIFDLENKKVENYKLLNEEEEILLCKEEVIKSKK